MHGDGIKLDITEHKEPARLLDLTRLIRRAGRVPTGIDRVELAYLRYVVTGPNPAFGLVRSSLGYILLDFAGLTEVLHRFEGGHPLTRTTGLGEGSSPLQPPVETEAAMRRARAGVLLDSQIRREEARDEAELTLAGGRAFVRGDGSGQYGAPEPILSQKDL